MTLTVIVVWPSGRGVNVEFRAIPELGLRATDDPAPLPAKGFLSLADVESLPAFHRYLRTLTRAADDGSTLVAPGLESTVLCVFDLLDLEGASPPTVTVQLESP